MKPAARLRSILAIHTLSAGVGTVAGGFKQKRPPPPKKKKKKKERKKSKQRVYDVAYSSGAQTRSL